MENPEASVNVPAATSIVVAPSAVGVNVAVYVVPLPLNELRLPPLTVTSPTAKLVVAALLVKVTVRVASFVVEPSLTAELLPLTAVMVIEILWLFRVTVLLLCDVEAALPATSKIALLVGFTVKVSEPFGVADKDNPNT